MNSKHRGQALCTSISHLTGESTISDKADELASDIKTHPACNDKKGHLSPKKDAVEALTIVEELTEQDKELVGTWESCQTPITPLEDDEPEQLSSGRRFVAEVTKDVQDILEDQADDISVFDLKDDISLEELNLLLCSSIQDAEEAASEIISIITKELKLDLNCKTFCWRRVEDTMRVFFAHKFIRESVFRFVAKLRAKLDCVPSNKASVKLLIEGVDYLVEGMSRPEEQEIRQGTNKMCLYQRLDREISSGQHSINAKLLTDIVYHHLKPDAGRRVHYQVKIRTKVDKFMMRMRKWLRQQGKQHKKKGDLVSRALREIKVLVEPLLALIEAPLKIESNI